MDILNNESVLSWLLGGLLIFAFTVPYLIRWKRKQNQTVEKLNEATRIGANKALMQHPIIDLSRCIGCGICTKVCPEGEVLGLVGGKAVLINGSKCVGHEVCMESCPVGGIEVGLGDISSREDIPQLNPELESNFENIYIIGELGGLALIRNAVNQGARVAKSIQSKLNGSTPSQPVVVVGAGPAGLSCTISLMEMGLPVVLLDQSEPGGTILQYPRRKLVMVQPIEMPGYGEMANSEYSKEELLEIWDSIFESHSPDFRSGHQLQTIEKNDHGYRITTSAGELSTEYVVLALGRRGTPRKLEVPGEDLSKVAYKLMDAETYQNKHILVVGGGDSAVEAAVGLGQQTGNTVTLSYRKNGFARIKTRNDEQVAKAVKNGWINIMYESTVDSIHDQHVIINHIDQKKEVRNDYVFIFAGGIPPFKLMNSIGIQFGTSTLS
ncbi:MAG: NAD(P)-binding domain-containing protein [FCB group bacterium]|nr:NAD(P)-binding domain-containing protein [FCB group bacterium]MBL7027902.1 NAD(P)-binding domain-containing protein [Candidatus Neomarinimicrobiota bacterium]MBL7121911.1 NAD(P)-binding domain-containing protein [Candidatus Neomarinimicrobiota bacterium]